MIMISSGPAGGSGSVTVLLRQPKPNLVITGMMRPGARGSDACSSCPGPELGCRPLALSACVRLIGLVASLSGFSLLLSPRQISESRA